MIMIMVNLDEIECFIKSSKHNKISIKKNKANEFLLRLAFWVTQCVCLTGECVSSSSRSTLNTTTNSGGTQKYRYRHSAFYSMK